jgi:uncharacterized membrane protein|tara:strand:+ start:48502 stop:48855 length:354 start_codon:yes stop_codon:yes gene_type:complete
MDDLSEFNTSQSEGFAKIVYILYLASIVFGITSLIGLVMAYINQGDSPDWLKTHYRFQIRTFWIAVLYSLVAGFLSFIFIGYFLLPLIVIWLIIRCVKGMKVLQQRQQHPDPDSWLF